MRALDILDKVINSLASYGLFVILDNHMSDADWCCSGTNGKQTTQIIFLKDFLDILSMIGYQTGKE